MDSPRRLLRQKRIEDAEERARQERFEMALDKAKALSLLEIDALAVERFPDDPESQKRLKDSAFDARMRMRSGVKPVTDVELENLTSDEIYRIHSTNQYGGNTYYSPNQRTTAARPDLLRGVVSEQLTDKHTLISECDSWESFRQILDRTIVFVGCVGKEGRISISVPEDTFSRMDHYNVRDFLADILGIPSRFVRNLVRDTLPSWPDMVVGHTHTNDDNGGVIPAHDHSMDGKMPVVSVDQASGKDEQVNIGVRAHTDGSLQIIRNIVNRIFKK